jgi:hypothetical protein
MPQSKAGNLACALAATVKIMGMDGRDNRRSRYRLGAHLATLANPKDHCTMALIAGPQTNGKS